MIQGDQEILDSLNHRLDDQIDSMNCDRDVEEPPAHIQKLRLPGSNAYVGSPRSRTRVIQRPSPKYDNNPNATEPQRCHDYIRQSVAQTKPCGKIHNRVFESRPTKRVVKTPKLSDHEKRILKLLKDGLTAISTVPGFSHTMQASPLFRHKVLELLAPSFPFIALPRAIRERIAVRTFQAGHLGLFKASRALHFELAPLVYRFAFCRVTIGPYPLARPVPRLSRAILQNITNVSVTILRLEDPNIPDINSRAIHLFTGHDVIRRYCSLQIFGNPGRSWALSPQFIQCLRSLTCFRTLTLNLACQAPIRDPAHPNGCRNGWQNVAWNDLYTAATSLQDILGPFLIKPDGAFFQPWNFLLRNKIAVAMDNGTAETNPEKVFGYVPRLDDGARAWVVAKKLAEGGGERAEAGGGGGREGSLNLQVNGSDSKPAKRPVRLHLKPPALPATVAQKPKTPPQSAGRSRQAGPVRSDPSMGFASSSMGSVDKSKPNDVVKLASMQRSVVKVAKKGDGQISLTDDKHVLKRSKSRKKRLGLGVTK